ncbi:16S rRNA pseudouridine516 synthase [Anaerosporobacter mobilis DSM 15930]|uniref:Pseudouridine synthase n=1 Tax=Anaerosporobacter mobilis DSM 15930 TaxID=1120996 RepID=A0A1M7GYK1_9FIRM|nr:pseudouridine synthase [Anaerosporobacter mobilis]SHM21186.1 16S rRNA pseudouridine516 synthase [Anaerosporobacter mobilis DSM 15930]
MKELMRLDKYLADMGVGTRSEVKVLIKKRRVQVGNEVVNDPNRKIAIGVDSVRVDGREVSYVHYEYYMLNKPAGVLSATEDKHAKTVIDLIETSKRKDLFPVGRLDKDTEGLLLITNDGGLAHSLLSPKKHVDKEYYAKVEGVVTNEDVEAFAKGLQVDEDFKAMPAKLTILSQGEFSEITLIIQEGKFHQVKRMFEAMGKKVVYLKRLSMGSLQLDESLQPGEYREVTQEELALLK